jgi:hypothetical protein
MMMNGHNNPDPTIRVIDHSQLLDLWDSFVPDDDLTGQEWNDARDELTQLLRSRFAIADKMQPPGDFWIGEDWYHVRGLSVVFLDWRFFCFDSLKICFRFALSKAPSWHISIVKDGSALGPEGPDLEALVTKQGVVISARKLQIDMVRKKLSLRTDIRESLNSNPSD